MSLLGVDVGTNGCKAIILNTNGEVIARASRSYNLETPRPGWVELDADLVWISIKQSIKEAVNSVPDDPVQTIGVSAMGDTVTACDSNFNPLQNSIVAFDTRNIQDAEVFKKKFGKSGIFQITGQPVHPTYSITKIHWIKRNLPEIFYATDYFLCYEEFITAKLCGNPITSYSTASRTMAFNIHQYCWWEEILDFVDLSPDRLPLLGSSGSKAGLVLPAVAQELGLRKDVIVVVGGHDQPCGALACGLFDDGIVMDSTGTVEVLLLTTKTPMLTQEMLDATICFWPHVVQEEYCACGQILTAGAAFRWYCEQFGMHENDISVFDAMTSGFSPEPANTLFIPHLSGSGTPEFNPAAKGALYGLTLNTDVFEIGKSILEGLCFELKINIELLENTGLLIDTIRAVGGAVKSDKWMQLKADITGKEIQACQLVDQCPQGAAILAGFGIGLFGTLSKSAGFLKSKYQTFSPNRDFTEAYDEKFQKYIKFRSVIFELYDTL